MHLHIIYRTILDGTNKSRMTIVLYIYVITCIYFFINMPLHKKINWTKEAREARFKKHNFAI